MKDYIEPQEAYDWALSDVVAHPPYDDYWMVVALSRGEFLIEGKKSDWSDALFYAESHPELSEVWDAIKDITNGTVKEDVY